MALDADDIREFNLYLRQCTDAQVQGVYEKEMRRGSGDGRAYAALAESEASRRGLVLA